MGRSQYVRPAGQKALTLVELLVTLSILALVAVSIHMVFATAISARKSGERDMEAYQNGRFVMAAIGRELSSCYLPQSASDATFSGEADDLRFVAIIPSRNMASQEESSPKEVRYFLENGDKRSTLRKEEKALTGPGSTEESSYTLAEKVTELAFSYFDGESWVDTWNDEEELPLSVKITLGLESSGGSISFTRTIPILSGKLITIKSTGELIWHEE